MSLDEKASGELCQRGAHQANAGSLEGVDLQKIIQELPDKDDASGANNRVDKHYLLIEFQQLISDRFGEFGSEFLEGGFG